MTRETIAHAELGEIAVTLARMLNAYCTNGKIETIEVTFDWLPTESRYLWNTCTICKDDEKFVTPLKFDNVEVLHGILNSNSLLNIILRGILSGMDEAIEAKNEHD